MIKSLGRNAGITEIQKWNVSDILNKTKGLAIRLPEGWSLTSRGKSYVESMNLLPLKKSPKVVNLANQLREGLKKIANQDTREFIEEAIACFEAGLYRSCVVLSWIGAVSILYNYVINNYLSQFNTEAKRRDNKWKDAKILDDLSRMKESDFLEIICSPPISIIGKNLKEELKNNCLQLRNACGHPNSLKIGENKVAAHLEILILNIFSKFISNV